MHATAFIAILATALTAAAIQVVVPNQNQGWASSGSNTLRWERVSTDPTNFTVYLTNTDRSVLPENNLLLASFVDASSADSISIQMPSSGFNVGGSYRINLVKDQNEPNTIYAQSEEFDISSGSSSASGSTASSAPASSASASSASASSSSAAHTTPTATRTTAGPSATTTDASASGPDLNPSSTPNAAASRKAEFGLLGALLFLGGLLA